jgi:hypothetical protein
MVHGMESMTQCAFKDLYRCIHFCDDDDNHEWDEL